MTDMKNKIDWRIICFGIACITILEIVALLKGFDGLILTTVIAIIAAAIGVSIDNPFKK